MWPILLAVTLQLPSISPDAPGVMVSLEGTKFQPDIYSGALKINTPLWADPRFASYPPIDLDRCNLPVSPALEKGKSLVVLPYATDSKFREATLVLDRIEYKVTLPVAKATGPVYRKKTTVANQPFTITAESRPRRFSNSAIGFDIHVTTPRASPRILAWKWTGKSNPSAHELGSGTVLLLENSSTFAVAAPVKAVADKIEITAIEIEAVPIQLKVHGGDSTTPYSFSHNGKTLYTRHKLLPASGFLALKTRNIYRSNFGIRNRPAGTAPSYSELRDGDVIDAVGYRRLGNKPTKATLTLDIPKTYKVNIRSNAYLRNR
jgi:hypothetical protein